MDLSDGAAKQIPPLVVTKLRPVTVIVSLPDGRPAVEATAVIKDESFVRSAASLRFAMPPRITDKSKAVMTSRLGRAELLPKGTLTEQAVVEVKLVVDEQGFDAVVPLAEAVAGVLNVLLKPNWIVEGRVLIDNRPVAGAKVSIGQVTGAFITDHQQAVSGEDGWYRAAVSQEKQYSVSVTTLPGDTAGPGISYTPTSAGDGRLRVSGFAFLHGDQEIAGRVIDHQGNVVPRAEMMVLHASGIEPHFWIGHETEGHFDTDELGRFHLKNVPTGTFLFTVYGPRKDDQGRAVPTRVSAEAGRMDIEIILDPKPPLAPVR